jgi:hypothetical protein
MSTYLHKINDFVIRFANVNGTGSASANALFTKAVFRMGVPVTPKNIFPSNIQIMTSMTCSLQVFIRRRNGLVLLVFFPWYFVLLGVVIASWLWMPFRHKFVSLRIADFFVYTGHYLLAILSALSPLFASFGFLFAPGGTAHIARTLNSRLLTKYGN